MLHENDISARTADRAPTLEEVQVNGVTVRVLESCHSLWIFEPARGRFRRVPRGTRLDMPSPENEWTAYYRLELDASSGAFSVGLNEDDRGEEPPAPAAPADGRRLRLEQVGNLGSSGQRAHPAPSVRGPAEKLGARSPLGGASGAAQRPPERLDRELAGLVARAVAAGLGVDPGA